jgi:hypothetical protein
MSLDLDTTEYLLNSTDQAIGVAGDWTMLGWAKPLNIPGAHQIFEIRDGNINRMGYRQSGDIGEVIVEDQTGSPTQSSAWLNVFQDANWHQFGATWSNSGPLMENYLDGVNLGAPDGGTATPAVTMTDTSRSVAVGAAINGTFGFEGLIMSVAIFRVVLTAAQILATYNGGNGSAFDLNTNSGNYGQSGDLAHWWRCGHEADPNLGKDFAEAGFTPTIDIGVNKVGLDDNDRVADVPT